MYAFERSKKGMKFKMQSQKGITLVSLTIYIIGITVIVAVIAIISSYFYTNMDDNIKIEPLAERTNFYSFFTKEINTNDIKILECKENYIVFDNGIQYLFIPENKGIYRNKVKICREVKNCTFEQKIENGKSIVEVMLEIGDGEPATTTYTLQN